MAETIQPGDGGAAAHRDTVDHAPAAAAAPSTSTSPSPLLAAFNVDLLEAVLSHLPPRSLLAAGATCRDLAAAAETIFRIQHCAPRGWRPPRRPRGADAAATRFPWRATWRRHACSSCGDAPGEFQAWRAFGDGASARVAVLCGGCVRREAVLEALREAGARIDLQGVSGRALLSRQEEARLGLGNNKRRKVRRWAVR